MDKSRQQQLTRWLKQQSRHARRWLRLTFALGLFSVLVIIAQAWLLASMLSRLISESTSVPPAQLIALLCCFMIRALLAWLRERTGWLAGQTVRQTLRQSVLDRLHQLGPAWIQGKPAGAWATLLLEQIEEMQDYYAHYLPQRTLAVLVPCAVAGAVFVTNWAAGLILLFTAPLIPLFMALVGIGAAEANRRNFTALSRLSSQFLDRLRGLETLRLFHRAQAEVEHIRQATDHFRRRTMDVLRLAFLSSAVLEFFTSLSIAIVAVYFGFSYLGEFHFGSWQTGVTLFSGFIVLILAPEFFQPLRDLGTFYHAKAQAIGAADALDTFLRATADIPRHQGKKRVDTDASAAICARDLIVTTPDGKRLCGPLSFSIAAKERIALVGQSGAGKTSLLRCLLGFLPYRGSLTINGVELCELDAQRWQQKLGWVGQHPHLPESTIRKNITGRQNVTQETLNKVLRQAGVAEFLPLLPKGLDSETDDQAIQLSVGQAQRIAVARALLKKPFLLLLDEPGGSLDAASEQRVMSALNQASLQQTTLMITHQIQQLSQWDTLWLMHNGQLIQQGNYQALARQDGPFSRLLAQRMSE